jgi:ABC-type molybdenum transport system ATPase subunit/photorepair protein PhrA
MSRRYFRRNSQFFNDHFDRLLELRNVVARGECAVLHDVNLSIRAGEHVAILGPNG